MKKFLFLGLAAMMAFTSCTKDETLATAQNGAISFDVSADKATRRNVDPSITTDNITNFNVYGFMTQVDGLVFATTGEKVTGSNASGWTYTNTQYWTPNTYYFAAIAPAENPKWTLTPATDDAKAKLGVGVIDFKNAGTQDLLYWAGISDNTEGKAEDAPVAINFNHLLSKVKFSFVNEFDNANAQIEVLDIQITNAYDEGSVDLALCLSQYRPAAHIYFACANADDARTLSIVWGCRALVGTVEDAIALAVKELNVAEKYPVSSFTSTSSQAFASAS